MHYKDQLQRTIKINTVPQRVVCLVPSLTELLVDLGLKSSIVGLTKFCVHPKGLKNKKTIVGGTKQVHYDKIAALQPDFIICNKEENTKEIVETAATIAPVWVSDIDSIASNNEMISLLGDIFNVQEKANHLILQIEKEVQLFKQFMSTKPFIKALYLIWKNPYMAVGKGTFIDALLQLNNFTNSIKQERYPEVSVEAMQSASHVLLSSEPFPFKEKDIAELKKALPLETKVLLVDGEYFSWYGSRLLTAFTYFKTLHT